MITLRPYQKDGIGKFLDCCADGLRRMLMVLATGAGKGPLAAELARMIAPARTCALCDREELLRQLEGHFRRAGLSVAIEKADEYAEIEDGQLSLLDSKAPTVVVATFQTMARRAKRFPPGYFHLAVVDEAHSAITDSRKAVINSFGPEIRVMGLTATPYRNDLRSMGEVFDGIAYEYPLANCIKDGWLVPIFHQSVPLEGATLDGVRTTDGDLDAKDLHQAIRPHLISGARAIAHYASLGRRIIVFAPLIATSVEIMSECAKLGVRAAHIDGTSENRRELIADFNSGKIQALCNAQLLTVGVDIPSADCAFMFRPTKSSVLYNQMVGRITRTLPGVIDDVPTADERKAAIAKSDKPRALILDPIWVHEKHDIIRPAHLFCAAKDHADLVAKECESQDSSPRDVMEIADRKMTDVMIQREANLRKEIEANKHRGARLVDAMEYALLLKNEKLSDRTQMEMPWGKDAPTEKQLAALAKFGFDPMSIVNKGHASQLLDAAIARSSKGLASPRQIKFLKSHKYPNPEKATYSEASAFMDKKIKRFGQIAKYRKRRS